MKKLIGFLIVVLVMSFLASCAPHRYFKPDRSSNQVKNCRAYGNYRHPLQWNGQR